MSTQPAPSGRKGSKKVRTGCLTCKIRKVKCDEGRPACQRCIKAQRKCDGYRDTKSPARTSQLLAIRTQSRADGSESSSTPSITLPSWAATAGPFEVQAFDYYVKRAAPILSAEFDSYFWSGLVPRLCQAEPAVRHAVFALGTLYRGLEENMALPPPSDAKRDFALREYNKAISSLLTLDAGRNSGQDPSAIYLLTCVLFICIEFLLWDDASSLAHIHQGRQLLCRIDEGTTRVPAPQLEMIKRYLVPIFSRLAFTAFTNGANPIAIPKGMIECFAVPDEFRSVNDARVCLYIIMDDGLRFSRQVRPVTLGDQNGVMHHADMLPLVTTQQELLSRLKAWNVAFSLYLSGDARANSGRHTYGEQMLQVHFHTAYIWVSCSLSPKDSTCDDYLEHFAHIVRIASSMQGSPASQEPAPPSAQGSDRPTNLPIPSQDPASSSSSETSRQGSPSSSSFQPTPQAPFTPFTFDDNLIPAVYYTAIKCRHPTLRRKALDMLRSAAQTQPREGLWDARYVAKVADRVIRLEEEGSVAGSGICQLPVAAPYPHPAHDRVAGRERLPGDLEEPRLGEYLEAMGEHNGLNQEVMAGSGSVPSKVATSHLPPFGVSEDVRVRNTIIGPKADGGIWITIFRKPAGEWDVKKEFLAVP